MLYPNSTVTLHRALSIRNDSETRLAALTGSEYNSLGLVAARAKVAALCRFFPSAKRCRDC